MGSIATRRLLIALALVASTSAPAHADERTEARRHFRRGMQLVYQGDVDEGVAELEAAYAILPHADVLYNAGRAYVRVGRLREAIAWFERYIALDPPDRDAVIRYVRTLEARLASEAAAETAAPEAPAEAPSRAAPAAPRSEADVERLRAMADDLARMAEALDSAALRERAARLHGLADDLAAATVAPTEVETEPAPRAETTEPTAPTESGDATPPAPTEAEDMPGREEAEALYQEQVVSASSTSEEPLYAPNSTAIITRQDIRLTGITHIGELLRRVAGVQVMATGPADVNIGIRGFNQILSPRVLVLVNGRSVYADPLGITFMGNLPVAVEDIERIEVVRGPASALYGANGFSGVVNILTLAPGVDPGFQASAGVGTGEQARAYLSASGNSRGLHYRFSAGYQQYDRYTLPYAVDRIDATIPEADPTLANRRVHARGHLRYAIADGPAFELEGGLDYAHPVNLRGTGTRPDLTLTGPQSYLMGRADWGPVQLRTFWNRTDLSAEQAGPPSVPLSSTWDTIDVQASLVQGFRTGPLDHQLIAGGSVRRKSIDWELLDGRHDETHYAVFLQDTIDVGPSVRFVGGFRMDLHPLLESPVWSPRAALILNPGNVGRSLRFSTSTAFRTQTFLESYVLDNLVTPSSAVGALALGSVPRSRLFGTDPLRPERILSAEIGYRDETSEHFLFEVAAYYNRVRDLVRAGTSTTRFTLLNAAALPELTGFDREVDRFVVGASGFANDPAHYDVTGGEITLRAFPVDGLDLWVNGSLNLAWKERDGTRTRVEDTSLVQVNGGVQYRARFGLDVAADVHYASRTVWIEQAATTSGVVGVELPLPSYVLVNARVGYRLLDDALDLGIVATNLGPERRQHPLGQPTAPRVMVTAAYRF